MYKIWSGGWDGGALWMHLFNCHSYANDTHLGAAKRRKKSGRAVFSKHCDQKQIWQRKESLWILTFFFRNEWISRQVNRQVGRIWWRIIAFYYFCVNSFSSLQVNLIYIDSIIWQFPLFFFHSKFMSVFDSSCPLKEKTPEVTRPKNPEINVITWFKSAYIWDKRLLKSRVMPSNGCQWPAREFYFL